MRRATAVSLGVLWLLSLLGLDAYVALRPENMRQRLNQVLFEVCGKSVTYGTFEGEFPGPFHLRGVQIKNPHFAQGLGSAEELLLKIPTLDVWVDWFGLLMGRRPLKKVHFHRPWILLYFNDEQLVLPAFLESTGNRDWDISELPQAEVEGLDLTIMGAPYLLNSKASFKLDRLFLTLLPEVTGSGAYRFQGELDDAVLGKIQASGTIAHKGISLQLSRSDVNFSKELLERFDPEIKILLEGLHLKGKTNLFARFESGQDVHSPGLRAELTFRGTRVSFRGWQQAIEDLRGTIEYHHGVFRTHSLGGLLSGASLELAGGFDLASAQPGLNLRAHLKGLMIDDRFVDSVESLPPPGSDVAKQLRSWQVRGRVNAELVLTQTGPGGADIHPDLKVDLLDCDFMYQGHLIEGAGGKREGFHYPLTNLRGRVRITDSELHIEDISADRELMSLRAAGTVHFPAGEQEFYDVTISLTGLPVDDVLLAALSPDVRDVLHSLGVQGAVHLMVHPARRKGEAEPAIPDLRVNLDQMDLLPREFPFLIENVVGVVRVADGLVQIEDVSGRHGSGTVTINGQATVGGERSHSVIRIEGTKIPLDRQFLAALVKVAPQVGSLLDQVDVSGSVDIRHMTITQSEGVAGAIMEGDILLSGVKIRDRDSGLEFAVVRGGVHLASDQLNLLPGTVVAVEGINMQALGRFHPRNGYRCTLKTTGHQLSGKNFEFLQHFMPALEGAPQISSVTGELDLEIDVRGGHGREDRAQMSLGLHDVSCGLGPQPGARAEGLECQATFDLIKKSGRVFGLQARILAPREVTSVNGTRAEPDPWKGDKEGDLAIYVNRMDLDLAASSLKVNLETVKLALPTYPWFLALLGLSEARILKLGIPEMSGSISAIIESMSWNGESFQFNDGTINIRNLQVGSGSSLFVETAVLQHVELSASRSETRFRGLLGQARMRLFQVPLFSVAADIHGSEAGVLVTNLGGKLVGEDRRGRPFGTLEKEKTTCQVWFKDGAFKLHALLQHVDMAAFSQIWGAGSHAVEGTMSLEGNVRGLLGHPETFNGTGVLTASARGLLELPLFLKVLNVLPILDPIDLLSSSSTTLVSIRYDLDGDAHRLLLPSIRLESSSLKLKGGGYITFDGLINASLDATHTGPVPILSMILALIPSAIMGGVDIEGPIENPKVVSRAFSGGGVEPDVPGTWSPVTKPLKR